MKGVGKKLSKAKIEQMANEVIQFLKSHDLQDNVCIYYNNKRICFGSDWDREIEDFIPYEKTEENINPLNYIAYANSKHILSMSFEGDLYRELNGYYKSRTERKLLEIFEKYGLYYEFGESWNLTCCPDSIDYDEIEYTLYQKEPDAINIYSHSTDVPTELIAIKHMWDRLSETTQHLGGSCAVGDGFDFKYKGKKYHMATPAFQGSMIYEHWITVIRSGLDDIGATEVHYNYGNMN